MGSLNLVLASTEDYRRKAEKKLPRFLFDYLDGGSYQERTLAANCADFEALQFKQRVLYDVSKVSSATTLFGDDLAMPAAMAPIGMAGMMAQRGELQAKRAADALGIPFTLSTVSICSLEEVAKVSDKPFWFQLYMLKDRGAVVDMLQRARAVNVDTLIFTVDLAVLGARYRDVRNGMSGGLNRWAQFRSTTLSFMGHPSWAWHVGIKGKPHTFGNLKAYVPDASTPTDFQAWIAEQVDPSVTWKDIEWLRHQWDGNLIIKGVLSPEDAVAAVNAGADGISVSNHGGRQLDSVSSAIAMLPRVVDAVGDRCEVLLDSGVRSGADVLKARALGAKAVLIGRPWVYAAAAGGEAGITSLLNTFKSELQVAMALTGVTHTDQVDARILDRR